MKSYRQGSVFRLAAVDIFKRIDVFNLTGKNTETKYRKS